MLVHFNTLLLAQHKRSGLPEEPEQTLKNCWCLLEFVISGFEVTTFSVHEDQNGLLHCYSDEHFKRICLPKHICRHKCVFAYIYFFV